MGCNMGYTIFFKKNTRTRWDVFFLWPFGSLWRLWRTAIAAHGTDAGTTAEPGHFQAIRTGKTASFLEVPKVRVPQVTNGFRMRYQGFRMGY